MGDELGPPCPCGVSQASALPFLSLIATRLLGTPSLLLRGQTSQTWQVLAPRGALTLKKGATAGLVLVSHLEEQFQAELTVSALSPGSLELAAGGQRGSVHSGDHESLCSMWTCS